MSWKTLFRRKQLEHDLEEEISSHLLRETQQRIERGESAEDAGLHARRDFGNIALIKDTTRDMWGRRWLDEIRRNSPYAVRTFIKNPGFAAAAILTFALAIGANTAIFSVLEGAVLEPLPFRDPDRLVLMALFNRALKYPTSLSYPDFLDWQQSSRSFEEIAAFRERGFDLSGPGTPEHVPGKEVSANFFRTLGVALALGRELSSEEDKAAGLPVVIISNRLWRDRFANSPSVLGKTIIMDGTDYTITGVLRPGFHLDNQEADVYTAIGRGDPLFLADRAVHDVLCIGRLHPALSIEQARSEMNIVQEHVAQLNPNTARGQDAYVIPLKQFVVGDVGQTLSLLLGAVGLLLLIACSNVANLLLARCAARRREFAVRVALGASRAQIMRYVITESVLLSLIGGALALAFAKSGLAMALAWAPGSIPRTENIGLNVWVLLFTFGVSTAVGIVFGLAPAFKNSRTDPQSGLKDGGSGAAGGHQGMQRSLVLVQIALTVVLLMGGGLLFRTIRNLWAVNPGFDPTNVITFRVGLSSSIKNTAPKVRSAYEQLLERIRNLPGVEAADISADVMFTGHRNEGPFWLGSQQPASLAEIPRAIYYPVGTDYLSTMKIPLVRGRFFTQADNIGSEKAVVVDSLLARTYFPDGNAVDRTITVPRWGAVQNVPVRIVGVVGHVEHYALDGSLGEKPQIYYSFYQLPDEAVPAFGAQIGVAVRTPLAVATVMPAIKEAVYKAGADQPVYDVRTMQEIVSRSLELRRFLTVFLMAFAGLGLVLASVGTYGIISYSAIQRMHEIGIRMALGANRRDVLRMVIGQGISLALLGVGIGASAALILAQVLPTFSTLLYGIKPADPLTFAGTLLVLLSTAIFACYLPARRAARLDPMIALRQE